MKAGEKLEIQPTKKNLQSVKYKLYLATQGYDMLDKKRKLLLRQIVLVENTTKRLKMQLILCIKASKKLIFHAKSEIAEEKLKIICEKTVANAKNSIKKPPYSLHEGTVSLDEAFFAWQEVKLLLEKLVESEKATKRIRAAMKKARKRAAALQNITIPNCKSQLKYISNQLEERERDELARIKFSISVGRENRPTEI